MSKKVTSRVARGQVWIIKGDDVNYKFNDSSVIGKTRPYVIVSCKENNLHSCTFNAVPISGRPDKLPMHVQFMEKGKIQSIQVEQIRTFDVTDLKEYQYTLSDEIMSKVNAAIVNQLELYTAIPSYNELVDLVENIAKIKAKEFNIQNQKVTNDTVKEIASRIESVFSSPVEEDIEEINEEENPQEDIPEEPNKPVPIKESIKEFITHRAPENINKPKKEVKFSGTKNTSRNKWTPENKKKFLEDCEKYGPEDVASKWGLKDKRAVFSYKYLFKGELGMHESKE